MPQTLNLNVNANLQLPPTVTPDSVPEAAQAAVQQMLQGVQQQIHAPSCRWSYKSKLPFSALKGARGRTITWRQITIETA